LASLIDMTKSIERWLTTGARCGDISARSWTVDRKRTGDSAIAVVLFTLKLMKMMKGRLTGLAFAGL